LFDFDSEEDARTKRRWRRLKQKSSNSKHNLPQPDQVWSERSHACDQTETPNVGDGMISLEWVCVVCAVCVAVQ
jgi:hypothetical protein